LKKLNMIWRMGERADARSRHGAGEAVGSAAMRKRGRWQPDILSGASRRVVLAARPGWTRVAPVVTWALRPARIDAAGVFLI
jgi:hypothetical protein